MNDNRNHRGKQREGVIMPVPPSSYEMPEWYGEMFDNIKKIIANARRKAMWTANKQMMMMYYHIGQNILQRQREEGWGMKVIDRLSADLKETFPNIKGFSPRNLGYMKKFASIWPNESILQRSVAKLSWRHNIVLMEKIKEPNRRLIYAMAAVKYGWSYNILDLQQQAYTLEREGKLPNNFPQSLPDMDSDMIQQMFKDPYLIDFTGADENSRERDIENRLTQHITNFLLELGQGFAFVGRQVHLEVGGDDFYIDMLFYHLKLRCYVVIELKAVNFNPGMMGELNMYMSAVDDLLRQQSDNPTIGLLLVKNKNETVVRYSLEGYKRPIGVASWETALAESAKDLWKSSLPTIEEIEHELDKANIKDEQ